MPRLHVSRGGLRARFLRTPHKAGNGGQGDGLPAPGRCIPAGVRRPGCGGRAVSHGAHRRQGHKAGATLPYLTNGNVATVTAENTKTEG